MQKFLSPILILFLLGIFMLTSVQAQVIQPQTLNIVPTPAKDNYWFGVRLPNRNLSYFGVGVQFGIVDTIAKNVHLRFKTDYYPLGPNQVFELGGNVITTLSSSALPEAPDLLLNTYLGGGPRALFSSDGGGIVGFGGVLGAEVRKRDFAGFAEIDLTPTLFSIEPDDSDFFEPLFVLLSVGVNFYF